ncbi:MAG: (d)CMP kinase [Oscillospiraceae bacterium]|nr:(d)CMP kinase [Oscillospiraceae bacterium]MDD7538044.1 (d)CMP kinase [Oscillospiraceae bacterium]MDY5736016.1 (d)CMP kinase [Oscillospiraceae bacterium]MDY6020367.1 (d)CMP kinase [Oscillospiraceae bacterium]
MAKEHYSIAVDGPSGAGKSTLAKALARELNIIYVDTGAIYRTIGLEVFRRGLDPKNEAEVSAILPELSIRMEYEDDGLQHMFLNGEDVTADIRLPSISLYASDVSALPAVRAFLLEMQRELARRNCVIMDGRDIGTVVLPDAEVKIYLTASAEERAKRRFLELAARGAGKTYQEVLEEQRLRDDNDMHRAIAPLKPAEDSVIVDTTELDFEQSKQAVLSIIRERVGV